MDAFISQISHHATSYAIRSCISLTSNYVLQHGSRLLKTVDDTSPLHAQLTLLHRRLTRKIELISPILETLEFHYTRGNTALEPVVRTAREIRAEIDDLAIRFEATAVAGENLAAGSRPNPSIDASMQRTELLSIVNDIQELILRIDDSIPGINMWVSAIGGIQSPPSSFSPSRLLQASYLVNVGDTQHVLNPSQPTQIGPNFILSLYMLFRGHASQGSEQPYGMEEGQRKPMWQEVIHKARVRLCRVPFNESHLSNGIDKGVTTMGYAYQLQIVEDLDDGRVHTFDDGDAPPTPYDGITMAGIREFIPVGQVAKMLYADVGRILNINNEDGASSNPVLLLKRDIQSVPLGVPQEQYESTEQHQEHTNLIEDITDQDTSSPSTLSESSQDDIDRQLREELEARDLEPGNSASNSARIRPRQPPANQWKIPPDLDPEWIALEVFEFDEDDSEDEDDEPTTDYEDSHSIGPGPGPGPSKTQSPKHVLHPSVDPNLVTQLHRMSLTPSSIPSSRASSRSSFAPNHSRNGSNNNNLQLQRTHIQKTSHTTTRTTSSSSLPTNPYTNPKETNSTFIDRSPFGAIRTSLSLLEMLLRLASLQEFEQATHLAIPDHVLRFYLDENSSSGNEPGSGLSGGLHGSRERLAARAEAERKVGFDPYVDSPVRGGGGGGGGGGF